MAPTHLPLPPALTGDRRTFTGRAGGLSYYVKGSGSPMLLLHSINAAGSAYEVKPVYEWAAERYRVYALDLPGFGFSERSDRNYDIRLYVDAIHDMLDTIAGENGGAPVDALALSLVSEYLARAATEAPERFRSLALVTPTGFTKTASRFTKAPGSSREIPGMYAIVSAKVWSQGLYDLLVKKGSIRYFLKRTFGSDNVPGDMVDYDYLTTHQPGARFAPLAFLSGRLFSGDIRLVYEKLTHPIWVPHATRGDFKDFRGSDWAKERPNWHFQPCPAGALPMWEDAEGFVADYERFLAKPEAALEGSRMNKVG